MNKKRVLGSSPIHMSEVVDLVAVFIVSVLAVAIANAFIGFVAFHRLHKEQMKIFQIDERLLRGDR